MNKKVNLKIKVNENENVVDLEKIIKDVDIKYINNIQYQITNEALKK